MTNLNPEEDLKLCEAATEGPWAWINSNANERRAGRLFSDEALILDADPGIFVHAMTDAIYIAQSRTLLPAYIHQHIKDRERIEELEQVLDGVINAAPGKLVPAVEKAHEALQTKEDNQ